MLWALGRTGWMRCVGFAAAGATAFGLVSALMRLVSLNLTTGVNDLDDVGVWLPAGGIVAALLVGGWAVQQAHAAGAPAVVVGCMTVIDPLVAVVLGMHDARRGRHRVERHGARPDRVRRSGPLGRGSAGQPPPRRPTGGGGAALTAESNVVDRRLRESGGVAV